MGAIWDFISGKSTDWDEVNEEQSKAAARGREYLATHPRERSRKISYIAYCKICGRDPKFSNGAGYRSPAEAIQILQRENLGCGVGNHIPAIHEVDIPPGWS